jgi:hypothetical protein
MRHREVGTSRSAGRRGSDAPEGLAATIDPTGEVPHLKRSDGATAIPNAPCCPICGRCRIRRARLHLPDAGRTEEKDRVDPAASGGESFAGLNSRVSLQQAAGFVRWHRRTDQEALKFVAVQLA